MVPAPLNSLSDYEAMKYANRRLDESRFRCVEKNFEMMIGARMSHSRYNIQKTLDNHGWDELIVRDQAGKLRGCDRTLTDSTTVLKDY